MSYNPIISEIKTSTIVILSIGGIVQLIGSYFIISNSLSDEYIKILGLIFGLFLGAAGIVTLGLILCLEKITLKKDKLIIQGISKKTKKIIKIADIKSYKEIEKVNDNIKYKDLTIFTNDSKYTITSFENPNYKIFRKKLTRGKEKNIFAEKNWHYKKNRRIGISLSLIGLLIIFCFGKLFLNSSNEIDESDLTKITGNLAKKIEIERSGRNGRNISIPIQLYEYQKFKFVLGENGIQSTNTEKLLSNFKFGDKIRLKILNEQYQKKISKELEMSFWDKSFNYRTIDVYGIEDDELSYFSLNTFNRNKLEDGTLVLLFLGIGVFFFGYGVFELIKNKKPISQK